MAKFVAIPCVERDPDLGKKCLEWAEATADPKTEMAQGDYSKR
jgi:hypothetical protein